MQKTKGSWVQTGMVISALCFGLGTAYGLWSQPEAKPKVPVPRHWGYPERNPPSAPRYQSLEAQPHSKTQEKRNLRELKLEGFKNDQISGFAQLAKNLERFSDAVRNLLLTEAATR
jgi:hypothetical protein